MTNREKEHQRLIVDQFTKQVVPFSQMPDHSPELILTASEIGGTDTVLDVACGPGVLACAFAQVARHVTGIDLTPAMIEQARALQQSKGRVAVGGSSSVVAGSGSAKRVGAHGYRGGR
jgi:2-polyprenyl-3-methyl-5-hydroxy-6-metoxy-1,4-benzoquinol methylase